MREGFRLLLQTQPGIIVIGEAGTGEPTEGLAPLIVKDLEQQILRLKESGISILLSEQNIRSALKMIDRAYVIDNGRIRFSGTVSELESNEEVKARYLMV